MSYAKVKVQKFKNLKLSRKPCAVEQKGAEFRTPPIRQYLYVKYARKKFRDSRRQMASPWWPNSELIFFLSNCNVWTPRWIKSVCKHDIITFWPHHNVWTFKFFVITLETIFFTLFLAICGLHTLLRQHLNIIIFHHNVWKYFFLFVCSFDHPVCLCIVPPTMIYQKCLLTWHHNVLTLS